MSRAIEWLSYAEEDLVAAQELLESHPEIALYHGHQAAEKAMKALYVRRHREILRTHDLVRLYHELDLPVEFRSVLEDLNPADTAVRYPDAGPLEIEDPAATINEVSDLLTWTQRQFDE